MEKKDREAIDREVWPPVFTADPVDLAEAERQQNAFMNL